MPMKKSRPGQDLRHSCRSVVFVIEIFIYLYSDKPTDWHICRPDPDFFICGGRLILPYKQFINITWMFLAGGWGLPSEDFLRIHFNVYNASHYSIDLWLEEEGGRTDEGWTRGPLNPNMITFGQLVQNTSRFILNPASSLLTQRGRSYSVLRHVYNLLLLIT